MGKLAQPSLAELITQLEWSRENTSPQMAGFRAAANQLEGEIRATSSRKWPWWVGAGEAARLRQRVGQLLAAAGRVARVAQLVDQVESQLPRLAPGGAEALLASARGAWRSAELEAAEARLAAVLAQLGDQAEISALMAELEGAREALPARADVAPLAARLLALWEQAQEGRTNAAWRHQVQRFLAPLRGQLGGLSAAAAATAPSSTAPANDGAAAELAELAARIESWGDATGSRTTTRATAGALLAGLAEVAPEVLQERCRQASDWLAQMTASARAQRDARRREIHHHYLDFVAHCGSPPEAAELTAALAALAALDHQNVVDPVEHESCLRGLDQVADRLGDLVGLHETVLRNALEARLTEVENQLAAGAPEILPRELATRRTELVREREELALGAGRLDLLPRLARAEALRVRAVELAHAIRFEQAERTRLRARREELLAALPALALRDLTPHQRAERDRAQRGLEGWVPHLDGGRGDLCELVARGDDVLEGLGLAARRAQQHQASLLARLESLRVAGLDELAADFLEHTEALVLGVSAAVAESNAVAAQLAEANLRLGRYERYARRCASEQIRLGIRRLVHAGQDPLSAPVHAEAQRLLGEFAAFPSDQLPPLSWRRRLVQLMPTLPDRSGGTA